MQSQLYRYKYEGMLVSLGLIIARGAQQGQVAAYFRHRFTSLLQYELFEQFVPTI